MQLFLTLKDLQAIILVLKQCVIKKKLNSFCYLRFLFNYLLKVTLNNLKKKLLTTIKNYHSQSHLVKLFLILVS